MLVMICLKQKGSGPSELNERVFLLPKQNVKDASSDMWMRETGGGVSTWWWSSLEPDVFRVRVINAFERATPDPNKDLDHRIRPVLCAGMIESKKSDYDRPRPFSERRGQQRSCSKSSCTQGGGGVGERNPGDRRPPRPG